MLLNSINSFGQETFSFNKETIDLRGEWKLVLNQFLTNEEIASVKTALKIDVPGNWDEYTPERSGIGFGTYYTTIIVQDSLREQLSIEVPEISLAYKLYVNNELVGQVGRATSSGDGFTGKLQHQIYDLDKDLADTLNIIFHVSNFEYASGGLWYTPRIGYRSDVRAHFQLNKTIKLLIAGCIIIGGIFQITIYFSRREERFGLYFFFVSCALIMLFMSRGDMPIMDLFPKTSWQSLKKMVYISLFLIAPLNGLFLGELYKKYFNQYLLKIFLFIGIGLSLFTLIVSPRLSHPLIFPVNYYNLIIGLYLLICLLKAAYDNKFGSRFLLLGYMTAFLSAAHDILSTRQIIAGYAIDMIHVGTAFYILQLLIVISGRYIRALEGRESLSNHLKQVNDELEETVTRRTKKLSVQNEIIEHQNERLQKVIKEKDHLMAVVAHDLKAPFDQIHGLSDLLKENLKEEHSEYNKLIKQKTIDGKNLIENLVQMKEYEQEGFQVDKKPFSIQVFFEEKMSGFEKIAKDKDIALSWKMELNTTSITTDKLILGRILDNLISNAIKFSPKNEQVQILVEEKNDSFVFKIKDNGPGFTDKDKANIFKKFQKLSARPTAGESSTGLGLSIVKTLVELLQGTIEIESAHEKGTEMILSIPKSK